MNHWHFIAPPNEAVEKSLGVTRCEKCGRVLTDPESVSKGVGPVCEAHGMVQKHMGPKAHPSGSSQQAHAGGKRKGKAEAKTKGRAGVKRAKVPTSHTTAANAFSKTLGLKTRKQRPAARGHGKFAHNLVVAGNKTAKVGKTLLRLRYEKFKDPARTGAVTSYRHKEIPKITVDVSTQRVLGGKTITRVDFTDKRKVPKAREPYYD